MKNEIQVEAHQEVKRFSGLDLETFVAILDNVYKGVVCVDSQGHITFLSRSNERFYNLKPGEALGKHVTEVIENSSLHVVAKTGKPEIGQVMEVKEGIFRIVERIPIKKEGKLVGAVGKIMFSFTRADSDKILVEHIHRLERQISEYQHQIKHIFSAKYTFPNIVAKSESMRNLKDLAERIAKTPSTVLIGGESGTGKELFAQAIHNASPRRNFPFVRVNCASIPPELFESEFFGYVEGAFTGALRRGKKGQFQIADKGTIFLDEISEMPIYMQAKLLRVLQEKEIAKVGSDKPLKVDFRLIASSNKSLQKMVNEGSFREDLYYRLNVIFLKLPPLRERKEDLDVLVPNIIEDLNMKLHSAVTGLSEDAWELLKIHDWKGNVRELKNVLERGLAICSKDLLETRHFQSYFFQENPDEESSSDKSFLMKEVLMLAEKKAIQRALRMAQGDIIKAGQILGISRSGLYQKMKSCNIHAN